MDWPGQKSAADKNRDRCMSKLTWHSHEEAIGARAYAGWQYGDGTSRPNPYKCSHCGLWHLARTQA